MSGEPYLFYLPTLDSRATNKHDGLGPSAGTHLFFLHSVVHGLEMVEDGLGRKGGRVDEEVC